MLITVEVLNYKGQSPVERLSVSFDQQGGTLGRSPENHFILSDPQKLISREHAVISYENGCYYLQDASKTGTFISNKNLHVHQDRVQLDHGDRLRIGDYDLLVSITGKPRRGDEPLPGLSNDSPCPVQFPGLLPDFDPNSLLDDSEDVEPRRAEPHSPGEHNVLLQHAAFEPASVAHFPEEAPGLPPGFDIDSLLNDPKDVKSNRAESHSPGGHNVPPQYAAFEPPGVAHSPEAAPELPPDLDLDSLLAAPEEAGEDRPSPTLSQSQAYDALGRIFLEAAGIQDTRFVHQEDLPELIRTAGALFRETVAALGTLLRGRAASKSHLRTTVTTIQAVQNNPLKFASTDDALTLLLTQNHPGYLTGVEAVREGCADLIHHDLAMTAGVQAAVLALLARFNPNHVAQPYAEGSILQSKVKSKAKCWDAYCQAYRQIVAETEDVFSLEAFGQAYEEQMEKLRSQDHERC